MATTTAAMPSTAATSVKATAAATVKAAAAATVKAAAATAVEAAATVIELRMMAVTAVMVFPRVMNVEVGIIVVAISPTI
jgi:hypothetical protein